MATVEERVKNLIATEFEINASEIDHDTIAADVDGWDSLRHAMLIVSLEAEFLTELETSEITSIECVGDIIALFESKT